MKTIYEKFQQNSPIPVPNWEDMTEARKETFATIVACSREFSKEIDIKEQLVIYDLEIKNDPKKIGWGSHAKMGVSCVGTYDYSTDEYRIWDHNEIKECIAFLDNAKCVVGYNNILFDDKIMAAEGMTFKKVKTWDILAGIRLAAKTSGHHGTGFKLDTTANLTFGGNKSGQGAHAITLWEEKAFGELHSYCLNDVRITKKIMDRILRGEAIISGTPAVSLFVEFDKDLISANEQAVLF